MFFGQAKQLCPSLQSVPYDFQAYKEVALAMYETLARYGCTDPHFPHLLLVMTSDFSDSFVTC